MPRSYRVRTARSPLHPIRTKVYVKDPLVSERDGVGLVTVELPGEPWLGAGPTTARIEVIDEDEEGALVERRVEPLARGGGFASGSPRRPDNYLHHQVGVWAHTTRALGLIEQPKVLGRRVAWAFPRGRLVLRPHAFEEENAYYDRDLGAIHFGHYAVGGRAKRKRIYACQSHDVIVHELGHAVLDGLKPLYYELDSPDVAGFHEYFGDALAMVSSLTMREVVLHVVRDRPAHLRVGNLVSDLALEFGSGGDARRPPLRSASNPRTMRDLRGEYEEHDYSEVLTGLFYDLLCELYADSVDRRKRDPASKLRGGQIVVGALISAAERTSRMMLRAIDYCPPCGLSYLDYVRAIHRSDEVAYPVDDRGYRGMLVKVAKQRGILRGRKDVEPPRPLRNVDLRDYDVDRLSASPTDAYAFLDANREVLEIPRDANFSVLKLYRTRKVSSGGYFPPREVVVEYAWPVPVDVDRDLARALGESEATLWSGGAIVFDTDGNVLYHASKGLTPERRARFLSYLRRLADEDALGQDYEVRRIEGRTRITKRSRMRHAGRRRT